MAAGVARYRYIDWARAIAVLVMIEAHTIDAWTRQADRESLAFRNARIFGGFAAPMFLWLAGVALVLSASRVFDKTGSRREAVRVVSRRGLEIFLLAFAFRLQAFILSPGGSPLMLLRVDILNIMGPAIVAAAIVWGLCADTRARVAAFGAIATAMAMLTPIVRAAPIVDALPRVIRWYIKPAGVFTTFTGFPWAGFVFAGAAVGALVVASSHRERRLHIGIAAAGAALTALGFYAAARPTIYAESSFWTSSPTYFAIRVGIVMMAFAALRAFELVSHELTKSRSLKSPFRGFVSSWQVALDRLGRSSLFVYWIHVELVYGYASWLWRGRLPLWGTAIAYAAFCLAMYGAVIAKARVVERLRTRRAPPVLTTAPGV